MKWHREALTKECYDALCLLGEKKWINDFYLTGGTALAFQEGHRISIDLDFFSENNKLGFVDRHSIIKQLKSNKDFQIEDEEDGTIHCLLNKVSVSLFYYNYPLIFKIKRYNSIKIASLEDIGITKLSAIIGRGSRKDFIDLFVVSRKIKLEKLIKLSRKKYANVKDFPIQALKALVYFKDADEEKMPRMIMDIKWNEIKEYFENEAKVLSEKILNKDF